MPVVDRRQLNPRRALRPLVAGTTWRRGVFLLLGGVLALLGPAPAEPVRLAVVPAAVVAVAVTAASIGYLSSPEFWAMTGEHRMGAAPILFFPAWGLALGAAAYAYHLRRRGSAVALGG